MFFIALLILTTLSIAGSAAYFSIYGLAAIFSGAFWPVVIMASSLEAGKLIAASYVYRYRKKISFLMKTYLVLAIFILMIITSAGIFGFLSSAYQQDVLPLEEMETRIELYENRKVQIEELKQERISQRARLDAQIDAIPGNHSTNRRKMRESQKEERAQIDEDLKRFAIELQTATDEHHKLKTEVIQQRVHTGPIIFIAKVFDREVDDATKWMIILIIFAFDPLAVVLTIGANIAILERARRHEDMPKAIEVYEEAMGIDEEVKEEEADSVTINTDKEFDEHLKVLDEVEKEAQKDPPPVIINEGAKIEEIRDLLREFESKPLTPHEEQQKEALEKTLRREQIVERTRRS